MTSYLGVSNPKKVSPSQIIILLSCPHCHSRSLLGAGSHHFWNKVVVYVLMREKGRERERGFPHTGTCTRQEGIQKEMYREDYINNKIMKRENAGNIKKLSANHLF